MAGRTKVSAGKGQVLRLVFTVGLMMAAASGSVSAAAPALPMLPPVEPLFDQPLRDTAIGRGPDGVYYLTGTMPSAATAASGSPDFRNNDGIYLWRSTDLENWEPLGKVWSLTTDARDRWTRRWGVPDGEADAERVRGVEAPEIHYLRDTFWIPFAMSHGGTGLLRSTSGKAEGPYTLVAQMTVRHGDPSLFWDRSDSSDSTDPSDPTDGTVYWVFGGGWIAPMKADLSGLAEAPRLIRPDPFAYESGAIDHDPRVGDRGAFLFHDGEHYHLTALRYSERLSGPAVHDTYVASAPSLDGPWSRAMLMVPHGGQTTVFQDSDNKWLATFTGDGQSVFRDRPGLVPVYYDGFLKHFQKPTNQVVRVAGAGLGIERPVVTAAGLMPRLLPAEIDGVETLRDPAATLGHDGNIYAVATTTHQDLPHPGIRMWKSPDLESWEYLGVVWDVRDWPYEPQPPKWNPGGKVKFEGIWSPGIYYIKGNYYIPWGPAYGGSYLLRSSTGKAEGPYEPVGGEIHPTAIAPALFEDDDGTVYYLTGGGVSIAPMKDDMSGLAAPFREIGPADGSLLGYEGPGMIKAQGKYILFIADTSMVSKARYTVFGGGGPDYASYDMMYCTADSIYGPFSEPRVAFPHCGESTPFRDADGNWWNIFFGSDRTAPIKGAFQVFPFHLKTDDSGELRFEEGHPSRE